MERKGPTPAAQSSRASASKLSNLHIAVSSFAALAGVGLAGYQAFAPGSAPQPLQVTVAIDPAKVTEAKTAPAEETVGAKADAEAGMSQARDATYGAALKDGSEQRYQFANLFDGKADTYLTIVPPDSEINVLVTFGSPAGGAVSEIEYAPPQGVDPSQLATVADIMVLPDGQIGASGRPVSSFKLPVEGGRQSFALAAPEPGKGLWLRVAGGTIVGDFTIRRAAAQP